MEKLGSVSPNQGFIKQNLDRVNKFDEKISSSAIAGGTLAESFKNSAKYKLRSKLIEGGTEIILDDSIPQSNLGNVISKINRLDKVVKTYSIDAAATNYESLINHVKAGNSLSNFSWKDLLRNRIKTHVEHTTNLASNSAKEFGKALAMNFAKVCILFSAVKNAGVTYDENKTQGECSLKCISSAAKTCAKELTKSLACWELASFGSVLAMALFPALGIIASICGGILAGGTASYLLEKLSPAPKPKKSLNTLN